MGSRKEKRLSPHAAKLLQETRTRYAHSQRAAIKHLMSVKPSTFNLYDRQKIGREILRRLREPKYDKKTQKAVSNDIFGGITLQLSEHEQKHGEEIEKIVHDYSLEVQGHSSNDTSKYYEKIASSRGPSSVSFPHDLYQSGRQLYAEGVEYAKKIQRQV